MLTSLHNCVSQVEFPEARIYEETLNILLYENRDLRPDPELMSRTKNNPRREDSDDDLDEKVEKSERTGKRK